MQMGPNGQDYIENFPMYLGIPNQLGVQNDDWS